MINMGGMLAAQNAIMVARNAQKRRKEEEHKKKEKNDKRGTEK